MHCRHTNYETVYKTGNIDDVLTQGQPSTCRIRSQENIYHPIALLLDWLLVLSIVINTFLKSKG